MVGVATHDHQLRIRNERLVLPRLGEWCSVHVFDDEGRLRQHLFGPRPYAEVLLAEDEGRAVGFALYFHNYSSFLGEPGIYLEDLFVEPGYRGRGHGKALLVALAHLAVKRGCARLDWVVLDWNAPAIQFYRSLGAEPMDEWTGYRLVGSALAKLAQSEEDREIAPALSKPSDGA